MSSPTPPTYKTRNWPAHNEALKRRGLQTIWFDPEMIRGAGLVRTGGLRGVQVMRRAVLLLLLASGLGRGWKALLGRTPAITCPDPIAVLEPVEIRGMIQC